MTIRNRVTLWYVGAMLLSLAIISGGMYYELVYERLLTARKGQPPEPFEEEMGEVILYFTVPCMLLAVLGGWWLLRRALSPLDRLTRAAERINSKNLREALPRTGKGDEVDRLSQVLNAMNQRIADALKEVHEFTLHASHELKTPLTILHSEIETQLSSHSLSTEQRDSLAGQLDEIQRLSRIVEGLILLARANAGEMSFAREPVAFHDLVREAAADAVVLAQPKNITVRFDIQEPATVIGDRHRLRQALLNLTDNAVKYNRPDGSISMELRQAASGTVFEIANTGPGIGPEEARQIFKKFFRGVSSNPGESNGIGLGLSIAQSIVHAHQGEISLTPTEPGWTRFRISLPKAVAESDAVEKNL